MSNRSIVSLLIVVVAVAGLMVTAPERLSAQPPIRLGSELQVNTFFTANQTLPAIARDADGDFVVVWRSRDQDGDFYGSFGQRFDSAGVAQGVEFMVNTYTPNFQGDAAVTCLTGGNFVVVWGSVGQDNSPQFSYGVFARRYDSAGTPQAVEFMVNTYTTGGQYAADVASDAGGGFVVVWSDRKDGSGYGIFAQRFDSAGARQGGEFMVNTYTEDHQGHAAIAIDQAGDFVVVWTSHSQDGFSYGIFGRRFGSSGTAQGGEFLVNTHTAADQLYPDVAKDDGGAFVVVWGSKYQDGSVWGIFAQRYDSLGVASGTEFQVTTYTSESQTYPVVGFDHGTHGFVVAWGSDEQDGSAYGVFGRRFDSSGAAQSGEFQVNSYTDSAQNSPALAVGTDGDFVVSWWSGFQDGDGDAVIVQRFASPVLAVLDVDGNGSTAALTDGLLVLRYLFGADGTTLTDGAVDLGACTRCDATAIKGYLDELDGMDVLDADDSGDATALTDGVLILRFLFGFTGTALTDGVSLGGCNRCDAASIAGYLETLI